MKYKTGKGYIIANYDSGDEETELEQQMVKLYAKRYSSESLWSLPKDLIQALARNDEVHYCRSCNQHTFTDIYWREEVSAGNAEQFCSHCDDYKPDTDDWYAVRANIDYDSYTQYRINSIIKSLNAIDEKVLAISFTTLQPKKLLGIREATITTQWNMVSRLQCYARTKQHIPWV